jgi:hypothetical protein
MRHLPTATAALFLLAVTPAQGDVHWLCGLSASATQLVCLAEVDLVGTVPVAARTETTAVVNGTRFPLDARHIYTVNFWSPATDLDFVDLLAQATLCYRSPGCTVTFTARPERTALHSARALN